MSDATSVIMYACPGPEPLCLGHSILAVESFLVRPIQAQNLLLLWQLHHHVHQGPGCGRGSQQVLQLRQSGELALASPAGALVPNQSCGHQSTLTRGGCGHCSNASTCICQPLEATDLFECIVSGPDHLTMIDHAIQADSRSQVWMTV